MKFVIILLALFLSIGCEEPKKEKFNLGFERLDVTGKFAKDWYKGADYEISLDANSHSGKFSGKITSDKKGVEGRIIYPIPAKYSGKKIRLEGYMKIENVEDGFAGLLIKIEGKKSWKINGKKIEKGGFNLGFENMQEQDVSGTIDWRKYSISLAYPEEAEVIEIGGILRGKGEAWFDDFVVSIDDKNIQTLKENNDTIFKANLDKEFDMGSQIDFPDPNKKTIDNLELLGKIWGFLKYRHPEVCKGNYNWDYELIRLLPTYLNVRNSSERDKVLSQWIGKYGKVDKCTTCKKTPWDAMLKPNLSWIKNGNMEPGLKEMLYNIDTNRYQGDQYYVRIVPNIRNPEFLNEKTYPFLTYPDKGFRILALFRYWNMIQYFYPSRNLTDKDWNGIMKEYLPIFMDAKNALEYQLAALKLIGELKDTHANLWGGNQKIQEIRGDYYPPFGVRFVGRKLVVSEYYNPELKNTAKLEIGDVISDINGRPVNRIADSLQVYYPASNKAARMRDIARDILRSPRKTIRISYISNNKKKQGEVSLYEKYQLKYAGPFKNDGRKSFKLLDGNIGYITLQSIKREEIDSVKQLFKDTKGIIIDIRNYPNTPVPFSLGSFFVSSATPFVKFTVGNIDNPGEFTFTKPVEIPKSTETYKGKLVVLVNEFTQSQAEYTTMAFRAGDNTTVIGSTTAGADGDVSSIVLPGGLRTMISGIGVYYPDGTPTQRIGILPDIVVKPTIKGIREGKDELLEKAIEVINQ